MPADTTPMMKQYLQMKAEHPAVRRAALFFHIVV